MLPEAPFFPSNPLVGWAIVVLAALVVVWIVLKIVGKAIKVSIRLAIWIALFVLIAGGLCWISSALGGLPGA